MRASIDDIPRSLIEHMAIHLDGKKLTDVVGFDSDEGYAIIRGGQNWEKFSYRQLNPHHVRSMQAIPDPHENFTVYGKIEVYDARPPVKRIAGVVEFDFVGMMKVAREAYKLRSPEDIIWVQKQFYALVEMMHDMSIHDIIVGQAGHIREVTVGDYTYTIKPIEHLGVACAAGEGKLCFADDRCNGCVAKVLAQAEEDGKDDAQTTG